jgi:hypothetical protein
MHVHFVKGYFGSDSDVLICTFAAKNISCGCILETPPWTVACRYIWAKIHLGRDTVHLFF